MSRTGTTAGEAPQDGDADHETEAGTNTTQTSRESAWESRLACPLDVPDRGCDFQGEIGVIDGDFLSFHEGPGDSKFATASRDVQPGALRNSTRWQNINTARTE